MSTPRHQRTQHLLLLSKLLDFRDNVSPFTLLLDSLEQSARPVIREIISRANINKTCTILLSFESILPVQGIDHFIEAYSLDPQTIFSETRSAISASTASKHLIIIDSLGPLLSTATNPSTYLTSLLAPSPETSSSGTSAPSISLLATYHTDVPRLVQQPYQPSPLTLLSHLATAVLTLHAQHHVLAQKAANARSVAVPVFGLAEALHGEEGIIQGLGANSPSPVVVEADVRRRSGREVTIWFLLDGRQAARHGFETKSAEQDGSTATKPPRKAEIVLLDDHPRFSATSGGGNTDASGDETQGYGMDDMSFNLGLTEKQRHAREDVVLPYYDAQREGGEVGQGGRILYDMGIEDDFDEEEDEI